MEKIVGTVENFKNEKNVAVLKAAGMEIPALIPLPPSRVLIFWRIKAGVNGGVKIAAGKGVAVILQESWWRPGRHSGETAEILAILEPGQKLFSSRSGRGEMIQAKRQVELKFFSATTAKSPSHYHQNRRYRAFSGRLTLTSIPARKSRGDFLFKHLRVCRFLIRYDLSALSSVG